MKKRAIEIILCAAMCIALIGGCGSKEKTDSSSKKEETKKTITVGCEATTPGWVQVDDEGNISGYDYDVWMEIGERTGYKINYKVMDWDGMWAMFDDGRLDSVGEQISYTKDRADKYNMSEPYAYNVYSLLCAADNENLQSMEDLKDGMTICCESNTSDELVVQAIDEEYNVTLEPTYYDGMSVQEVALGRVDLWPRAKTSCETTIQEVDNLKILGDTNRVETNVYPFAKTDEGKKLCDEVSKAIKEMKEDGTLKELSEKWFQTDITVQPEGTEILE